MDYEEQSIKYIKENKRKILNDFVSPQIYKPAEKPLSFFMAGSPGAGKTEFSKAFIKMLEKKYYDNFPDLDFKILRIDGDEIRDILPLYDGTNAYMFQRAISAGVSKLFDYSLKKKLNFLLDGTFSSEKYAIENITRVVRKNRFPEIFFIYQDPILSWKLTRAREAKEGRRIPKSIFIEDFFKSKENANMIKKRFKDNVTLNLIIKDYQHGKGDVQLNIDNIDNFIKNSYDKKSLKGAIDKM